MCTRIDVPGSRIRWHVWKRYEARPWRVCDAHWRAIWGRVPGTSLFHIYSKMISCTDSMYHPWSHVHPSQRMTSIESVIVRRRLLKHCKHMHSSRVFSMTRSTAVAVRCFRMASDTRATLCLARGMVPGSGTTRAWPRSCAFTTTAPSCVLLRVCIRAYWSGGGTMYVYVHWCMNNNCMTAWCTHTSLCTLDM